MTMASKPRKNQKKLVSDKNDKAQQPAPPMISGDIIQTTATENATENTTENATENITEYANENAAENAVNVATEAQENVLLPMRPPTTIEEQVKAAAFSSMGMGPVTMEDTEERQLSDDLTAQILERSRIGTALFYVPILNPVWKVSCV